MPIPVAKLNAGGKTPEVEIFFGHAHFAKYELWLRDANNANPKLVGSGVNSDNIPDNFPIGPVASLNNNTITWRAAIASPQPQPDETYAVFVRVLQDGKVAGMDAKTGPINSPPPYGFIRLEVQ
jgi:hypothetical protein